MISATSGVRLLTPGGAEVPGGRGGDVASPSGKERLPRVLDRWSDQARAESCPDRWPLVSQDRVDAGVAERPVSHDLVGAEDTVQLGAEALDRLARAMVEMVRPQFHRIQAQRLEAVTEEQELELRVDPRALD